MIGRTVSHYRILDELGRGGMGVLYRAHDERLNRDVALKFLPDSVEQDRAAEDRFLREARAASALNHPSICTIYDIGEEQGRPFLVLELLEGETLRESIRRGPLGVEALLHITRSLLEGLQAAHRKGIVHRDIKPENIFLTRDGGVKLLDFGLATLTGADERAARDATALTMPGTVLGTVCYMSPEQLKGESVDARTDLYSLGMVLVEAATGTISTRKQTLAASLTAVLTETPRPVSERRPDLPRVLSDLIYRATRKQLSDRFQSAAEMLERIGSSLQPDAVGAMQSSAATSRRSTESGLNSLVRPPLVGRQHECRLLQNLLAGARDRLGKMVLIEGEPGIGKTRLLEHTLSVAEDAGMRTLIGRCSELEAGTPFLPFIEILERLARNSDPASLIQYLGPLAPEIGRLTPRIRRTLPDIPAPLEVPPERERHLLFSAVAELIGRLCEERPLVLALEDLHWADAATSALIQHVAADLRSLPLLIVGTHRPHTLEKNSEFSAAVGSLLRSRVIRRMQLRPLSDADVNLQLRALADRPVPPSISESIYQITEGNPFFVEELFDHLFVEGLLFDDDGDWKQHLSLEDFGVPEGILLVLGRRLERLSVSAHSLLQTAAVMGRTFRFNLLAGCLEESPTSLIESLEEAGRLGLIRPVSENDEISYAFSHDLVRRSLIDLMSPPRRQTIHLRVADVLERFQEDTEVAYAIDIAHHLTAAGSMASANRKLKYLSQAGREALAKTAFQEAADFYERAIAFTPDDPGTRGDLLFQQGLALTGLARWQEAHQAWTEALRLLEIAENRSRFGELSDIFSSQLIWLGQLEAAYRVSRKGISVLGDVDPFRRVRLLAWAGHSRSQGGNFAEGGPLTDQAAEEARHLGESKLLGHILTHKACEAFYRMRFRDAADSGEQAAALLKESPWDHVESRIFELLGLLGIGKLRQVRSLTEECMATGSRIGHVASLWMLGRVLGMTDFLESGDLDSFRSFAERDLKLCREARLKWVSEAHSWLGLVEWWSGNLEAADRQFEEAVALEPTDFSGGADWGCRFAFLGFSGRREEALRLYRETEDRLSTIPQTAGDWNRLLLVVLGLAWLEEWERAGALYAVVRPALDLGSVLLFNVVGMVDTVAAVAAAAAGAWDEAERHFEAASRAAGSIPCRVEAAEVDRWHGQLLLRRGRRTDRERAFSLLDKARIQYRELGMPLHLSLVERCLSDSLPGVERRL